MIILNLFLSIILIGVISVVTSTTFQADNSELLSVPLFESNNLNANNKVIGLSNAFGELLFSTTGPVLTPNSGTGNAAGPTYNPPLKRCSTTESANKEGGFDLAKYMITGDLDKDKLKGNDFDFQIFADLVKDDDAEIKGNDAPYKASVLTDDAKKKAKVKLQEIATVCIDTQHVINIKEKTEIDLDKSEVFKSLGY
jgi:hypothetical protein